MWQQKRDDHWIIWNWQQETGRRSFQRRAIKQWIVMSTWKVMKTEQQRPKQQPQPMKQAARKQLHINDQSQKQIWLPSFQSQSSDSQHKVEYLSVSGRLPPLEITGDQDYRVCFHNAIDLCFDLSHAFTDNARINLISYTGLHIGAGLSPCASFSCKPWNEKFTLTRPHLSSPNRVEGHTLFHTLTALNVNLTM